MAHILLIEDDEAVVEFCRAHLGQSYTLEVTGDGERGLQAYMTRRPDLILLDVFMPRLDGLRFARELRQRFPGDHVPVVVWTGAYEPDKVGDLIDTPHVLPKPVNSTELLEVVRRALHAETRPRALRALMVSPSAHTLRDLVRELREEFDVHTASHWEEALALTEVRPYEAIVVDLPSAAEERDGAALLRAVAQRHHNMARVALVGEDVHLGDELLETGVAEVILADARAPGVLAEQLHAIVG